MSFIVQCTFSFLIQLHNFPSQLLSFSYRSMVQKFNNNVDTQLLSKFWQGKSTHIFYPIQEWHRRKRLIQASIPPDILLEWFLKLLFPYIVKQDHAVEYQEKCTLKKTNLIRFDKLITTLILINLVVIKSCYNKENFNHVDKI